MRVKQRLTWGARYHQSMSKTDTSREQLASLKSLDSARRAREKAELTEYNAVTAAREAGVAWGRIGDLYGLTKQGAQQRFKRPPKVHAPKV